MSNTIKFERSTVWFTPNISVDGYSTPSGEFRVGMAGASKALGFADNWLSRTTSNGGTVFKTLIKMGYKGDLVFGTVGRDVGGSSSVSTISLEDFNVLAEYAAAEGKPAALQIKGINIPRKQKTGNPEKKIQSRLCFETGGMAEVVCPAGKIDILTSTEIIEIKNVTGWKHALGQILVYGRYYPSHSKRIHLFGHAHSEVMSMVESHCLCHGVSVSWE